MPPVKGTGAGPPAPPPARLGGGGGGRPPRGGTRPAGAGFAPLHRARPGPPRPPAGPFWRWREGEGPQAGKAPRRVSWRERESSTGISRIWAATMQIVSVKRAGSMPNRPLPYMM